MKTAVTPLRVLATAPPWSLPRLPLTGRKCPSQGRGGPVAPLRTHCATLRVPLNSHPSPGPVAYLVPADQQLQTRPYVKRGGSSLGCPWAPGCWADGKDRLGWGGSESGLNSLRRIVTHDPSGNWVRGPLGPFLGHSLPPVYESLFAAWAVFWGQGTFAFTVMHRPSHPWGQVCAALLA